MQLQTERLDIRPFTHDDVAEGIDLLTHPAFSDWSVEGPLDEAGARAKLHRFIGMQQRHGFSKLALLARNDGRLLGYCGFGLLPVEGLPQAELGYRLHPDARGSGMATEAARAVITGAFAQLEMPHVQAYVDEGNLVSRRVLEKLGLTYRRHFSAEGKEWMLYRVDAPTDQ